MTTSATGECTAFAGAAATFDTAGITPPSELLAGLSETRQAHSRQVARSCAEAAGRYVPSHVELAEIVGLLHDVGYTPAAATTGFHPLDGAAYLDQNGYPLLVCHLVAGHAGSPFEHLARSGDLADYDRWNRDWPSTVPVDELRSILAWATSPPAPTGPSSPSPGASTRSSPATPTSTPSRSTYAPPDPGWRWPVVPRWPASAVPSSQRPARCSRDRLPPVT